jgi:RNA polymerase sigma factor (TIGR02999 family)
VEREVGDITRLLVDWGRGDRSAYDRVVELVYPELKRLARHAVRRAGAGPAALQPTAVVHEAYLRLARQNRVAWQDRAHFFGVAATVMRRVLLQHARAQRARKRGGGTLTVSLDAAGDLPALDAERIVAIDAALRGLEALAARQARVAELRVYGGLEVEQVAALLGVSAATVKRDWRLAAAWLRRELAPSPA